MSNVTTTGLDGLQAALQHAAASLPDDLNAQMRAELEKSAKTIAAATPRTVVKHAHMDESYRVVASGKTLNLVNTRPYAAPVLYAQRKTAGAISRQKRLNAAIDAEVERLADIFSQFGINAERKVSP